MKIKTRILIQTLSASGALILILGAVSFLAVAGIRKAALANSNELGDSAAVAGAHALEVQLSEKITRIAQDAALILDERLRKIENHTRMTADIAGSIYTTRQGWNPKPLPRVRAGEIPPPQPYLYIVPGVDYFRVRAEAELVGNTSEILRQITVVDRGIATSAIGGEAGYTITMDANPWLLVDFDPRVFNWYRGAVAAGGLYWTDVYEDHRGRGPAITCAVPFYEQSADSRSADSRLLRGVARSTVMLSELSEIIDSTGLGRTGQLFIMDNNGVKIYSSDGADIVQKASDGALSGENFLESPNPRLRSLGLSMTLGAFGMTELEMDEVPVYAAYAPIQTLGWSLGVTVSLQEISASAFMIENQIWRITDSTTAAIDRYIFLLAAFIALLLLLSVMGIGVYAVRSTQAIAGPILALNNGVYEVAGGNLEREVVVKTGDELEQLAVSFNMMTAQLRKHIAEIARTTAEHQRIDTELEIATRIQMSMLPGDFPPFRGRKNEFDLYAQVYPAKEVGGDFYDFFFIDDDHFAVIVADVSGKGVPAALFMAITKTIIKNRMQSGEEPALAMEIINHQLCDNNIMDMFVTVWLCILEISSNRLVYVNAGHNQPMVRRSGAGFTFLVSPPDMPLAGMDDTRYHSHEMRLESGDMLFLYTDGIVEASDLNGAFYGKERLRSFLNANFVSPNFVSPNVVSPNVVSPNVVSPNANASICFKEMLPRLRADIAAFAGDAEQSDDITMLAIRITGGHPVTHRITLKAAVSELDALNAFIGHGLDAGGCPARIRGQIELAAEEIFVNVANYAYNGEGGEVTVDCRVEPSPEGNAMTLVFSDRGRAFDPLDYDDPDITLPLEEREPGGLGLLIVKKTMDTIQYRRENGTNRLEFSKTWQKEEK